MGFIPESPVDSRPIQLIDNQPKNLTQHTQTPTQQQKANPSVVVEEEACDVTLQPVVLKRQSSDVVVSKPDLTEVSVLSRQGSTVFGVEVPDVVMSLSRKLWLTGYLACVLGITGTAFYAFFIDGKARVPSFRGNTVDFSHHHPIVLGAHFICGIFLIISTRINTKANVSKYPRLHKYLGYVSALLMVGLNFPAMFYLSFYTLGLFPLTTIGFQSYTLGTVTSVIMMIYHAAVSKKMDLHAFYGSLFHNYMMSFVRARIWIHLTYFFIPPTVMSAHTQTLLSLTTFTSTQMSTDIFDWFGLPSVIKSTLVSFATLYGIHMAWHYSLPMIWIPAVLASWIYPIYAHIYVYPYNVSMKHFYPKKEPTSPRSPKKQN